TVKFGNDQIAPILGYGDLVQGAVTIKRVNYVEGLNHNLFSVGQLCDANLEVSFRKSTCFIRDLKGNDLLTDGENLDKMKEKGDECIFVGYSTQSRAYRVFNKRTRVIMESIHVNFDELPQMASDQLSSDPAPECQTMALNHDSLSPTNKRQENVVSKSSVVSAADAPNQRQHHTTPLNIHTTPAPTCQASTLEPTVLSSENIKQAETYAENDQVADDEFINIFSTPVQDQGETSSRHQSVRTRRQLESDAEMCMFALTVSRTEPKNIKEAMAESAWIESM
nr:Gag-Pol polyprotein [Tanacetum cinerariifolium]